MKVKKGFVLCEVAGQDMVVATEDASKDFHGIVKLNSTGRFIWEALEHGEDEEQIAAKLAAEYEVEPVQAAYDVAAFVAEMNRHGFLE